MDSIQDTQISQSQAQAKIISNNQLMEEFIRDCMDRDFTAGTIRRYC